MDSFQDFKALRESVQSALVTVTRSVNALANEDLQFQRTVHPSVATQLDQNTGRLLELASGVLKSAGKLTSQRATSLDDVDDVEIQWKSIVDVIDSLLEKSDTCLDEYTGLIKRKDAPTAESGRDLKRPKSTTDRLDWSLKRANILKPQNAFERKTNNFDTGPWKPILTTKPHAKLALDNSLTTFTDEDGHEQYRHPYEHEILNMEYPQQVFQSCQPTKYLPIEKTKATWVDTYEGVLEMLKELKKATEIAIDLEHHDFRSYPGLLSLMQISTRERDWIVDTLVPWRHKLEVLNEVFADPKIVKVLHGAFMDIIWLQRDLGLYVVGLFDTHHACDVLGYAGKSLAFLLKKFADFDADKKYQLADWRIRPLPEEMFYYARSDTHYLLYIYDMLRNELAELSNHNPPEGKPIDRVLQKSREVSLQRYEHPLCDSETGLGSRGWYNTLVRSSSTLYNGEQFAVYKAVHKWRDNLARREDESPQFIMTQQVLSDIARIVPVDKKALWSLLDTNARGLKTHLDELFDVIQEARVKGASGPTLLEFFRGVSGDAEKNMLKVKVKAAATEAEAVPLSVEELKSDRSQLWGSVPISSACNGSAKAAAQDEQIEIPLFYSYTFDAGKSEEEPTKAPPPAAKPNPDPSASVVEDEGFTLKRGSGRKRKANDAGVESPVSFNATSAPVDAGSDAEVEQDEDQDQDSSLVPSPSGEEEIEKDDETGDDNSSNGGEEEEEGDNNAQVAQKLTKKQARKARRAAIKRTQREAEELRKHGDEQSARDLVRGAKDLGREAKRARRAAKKAARRQQQQQGAESGSADQKQHEDNEEEEPFDYSKAQSVLRAPKGDDGNGGGEGEKNGKGKRGKAVFDPYTKKSGDAPQGARKLNYERAGRTATFKK
ncbi:hypothetical protein VTK26DRAFT_7603 [Humicola hyalothermophila]